MQNSRNGYFSLGCTFVCVLNFLLQHLEFKGHLLLALLFFLHFFYISGSCSSEFYAAVRVSSHLCLMTSTSSIFQLFFFFFFDYKRYCYRHCFLVKSLAGLLVGMNTITLVRLYLSMREPALLTVSSRVILLSWSNIQFLVHMMKCNGRDINCRMFYNYFLPRMSLGFLYNLQEESERMFN